MAQLIVNAPVKASDLKGQLVNAYDDCLTPSTSTNPPVPLPACTATLSDTQCSFTNKGKGAFATKVKKGDIEVKAKLSGLNGACAGQTLTFTSDAVVTTSDCVAAGDCTTTPIVGFPVGTCLVAASGTVSKCSAKTTVEGFLGLGEVFKAGERYSIEISGVNVVNGANRAHTMGLIIHP